MRRDFVILFGLYFIFTLPLRAQQRDYGFKNVTIHEGLSQNSVVDIEEDPLGFMWFATQDGLNRYDGREFLIFPKFFDDITTAEHTQLGKIASSAEELWMVSIGGNLEVMDLLTQTSRKVETLGKQQLPVPKVSEVFFDRVGNLWVGTLDEGILFRDANTNEVRQIKDTGEFAVSNNQVRSIFEDSHGHIWVLTKSGLDRIVGGEITHYLKGINTHVITEDGDGNLWVGTLSSGLYVKSSGSDHFHPFRGFKDISIPDDLIVEAIHADQEDNVWVGTYGKGLYILQLKDSTQVNLLPDIRNPFSIGFQDILSIHQDSKGGIWIGTDGGGVSYYEKQFNNFRRVTNQNVSKNISIEQIRSISTDLDGQVWIGTSGQGLTLYQPSTREFETIHFPSLHSNIGNPDRVVSLLSDMEGDLWVGTQDNGLIVRDRHTHQIEKWFSSEAKVESERIPDNTIWCMLESESGQLWVGTRNSGLLLMDKEKGLVGSYLVSPDKRHIPDENSVRSIVQVNDSTLAVGFEKVHGVQLLNLSTGEFKPVHCAPLDWILQNETGIKNLYFQDGWLWIGTAGKGLVIVHLELATAITVDEKNGLPNNMIYGLLPENDSTLWASSNRGLFRINYTLKENDITLDQISSFSIADGLQSTEFNTGAFHKSRDGIMYFGGISGLNYFDPEKLVFSDNSFKVVLTGAMVGNSPLESDTLITYKNHLKLRYFENSLSFDYTVLDYVSPEKRRFFYQLEGYDEDWVDAGNRNYTAYTNLSPGDYRFRVKSSNNPAEDAPVTTLGISIAFPFWLEWWFLVAAVLLLALAVYGIYKYRINQLLYIQQVKNNISADLHDEIGSRLTNIQLLSVISKNNLNGKEPRTYLEKIESEVLSSAEALDEIVWNIKITDEDLQDIVARMRRYASDLLENDDTLYTMNVASDFSNKKMSMQKRRELFLIFKELLNNVRKHARAKNVNILVKAQNHGLELTVEDDGIGFDPAEGTNRNGLKNIKYRLEKWNGEMHLQSQINQGTNIRVWVPFGKTSFRQLFTLEKLRLF
ncbi:ligand-binding sensor domain-containing protein [Pleomorphovibrio marinus]|uniref:ligand-binding sensor domain-containing protein n=1 Tax=Pleomorphovibrio marinus TaxID=2164132 RepID=UPI000E0B2B6F|nr:sensor histidine kinase [Pleomorphovibrio marinus]